MWTWPEFPAVLAVVVGVQLLTLALVVGAAWLYVRAKARRIRSMIQAAGPAPFDPFETQQASAEELVQKLKEASERQ